jgi:hypothetical protein
MKAEHCQMLIEAVRRKPRPVTAAGVDQSAPSSATNFTDTISFATSATLERTSMRKLPKPTEQEISEGPQAVSFQIANGNARQGCVLQTKFPTKMQAQKYFLTNWPTIERMARDALARGTSKDGPIKLVMI